ncbi:MAG: elongation factor P [Bacillota bacterium]|nr:elongation factor P [Bacillota bacterium]NLU55119.1 elongation factor P [Bacillota bacterium]HOA90789.1 elongation factor P [Bacillota bacterium]HOJ45719.1 elongation factor P [Bacillota bacterium]HOL13179.1 elongation factor P [Bacillota bacterium]
MISSNDIRPGVTLLLEGSVWVVVEFLHVKPGKGAAFVRTKLKNVETGQTLERTFRAGEKLERAQVSSREMQYLYEMEGNYYFMDTETYEQTFIPEDVIDNGKWYLKENDVIIIQFYQDRPISVELPTYADLVVVETDPGLKGDTASGGSKPAKLETGVVVQVPLFVQVGDKIRVDTRTNEYLSRV